MRILINQIIRADFAAGTTSSYQALQAAQAAIAAVQQHQATVSAAAAQHHSVTQQHDFHPYTGRTSPIFFQLQYRIQ